MPTDPKTQRTLPAGTRLAHFMAQRWWPRQGRRVLAQIGRNPQVPLELDDHGLAISVYPFFAEWIGLGALQSKRRINALRGRKDTANILAAFDVINPRVREAIMRLSLHFAQAVNAGTKTQIRQVLLAWYTSGGSPDQLTAALTGIFHDPKRARMIGLSESSRSVHAGELLYAEESGECSGKVWLASSDACKEICLPMDGKEVGLWEPFYIHKRPGPYQVVMHPPAHPACACSQRMVLTPNASRYAIPANSQSPFAATAG